MDMEASTSMWDFKRSQLRQLLLDSRVSRREFDQPHQDLLRLSSGPACSREVVQLEAHLGFHGEQAGVLELPLEALSCEPWRGCEEKIRTHQDFPHGRRVATFGLRGCLA